MDEHKELDVVNIDQMASALEQGSLTEAKMKFETPAARQSRETRETADAAHERLLALLKLSYAGVLLLVFVGLGVYLFAIKSNATEAFYAFGKKQDKPDKE